MLVNASWRWPEFWRIQLPKFDLNSIADTSLAKDRINYRGCGRETGNNRKNAFRIMARIALALCSVRLVRFMRTGAVRRTTLVRSVLTRLCTSGIVDAAFPVCFGSAKTIGAMGLDSLQTRVATAPGNSPRLRTSYEPKRRTTAVSHVRRRDRDNTSLRLRTNGARRRCAAARSANASPSGAFECTRRISRHTG